MVSVSESVTVSLKHSLSPSCMIPLSYSFLPLTFLHEKWRQLIALVVDKLVSRNSDIKSSKFIICTTRWVYTQKIKTGDIITKRARLLTDRVQF